VEDFCVWLDLDKLNHVSPLAAKEDILEQEELWQLNIADLNLVNIREMMKTLGVAIEFLNRYDYAILVVLELDEV
jgi:hypothetical protein